MSTVYLLISDVGADEEEEKDEKEYEHDIQPGRERLPRQIPVTVQELFTKRKNRYQEFKYGSVLERPAANENILFAYVDPGHANIMSVTFHVPPPNPPLNDPDPALSNRKNRYRARLNRQQQRGVGKYVLKNTRWQQLTSFQSTNYKYHKSRELHPAWDVADAALGQHPTHTPFRPFSTILLMEEHFAHWATLLQRAIDLPLLRLNALFRFRDTQRSYKKIAVELRHAVQVMVGGPFAGEIVLVWGNGGFGPTSRGHRAAPNKKMRRGLSPFFPRFISSEHKSTQKCGAHGCLGHLVAGRGQTSQLERIRLPNRVTKPLRDRRHCPVCRTTWDRDVTASLSIANIFRYQRQHQTLQRPAPYQ